MRVSLRVMRRALLGALVALAGSTGTAGAAPGDLAFRSCAGDLTGCAATSPATALDHAESVVASPDGRHLYVAASGGEAVSHFTLDATGAPAFVGCLGDTTGCTPLPAGKTGAMNGPDALAISADGRHLYVAASSSSAVDHLTLDTAGTPSFADCIGKATGCTPIFGSDPLSTAVRLALSGDGKQLYVAGFASGVGDVSHLTVAASGHLGFHDCIGNHPDCTATSPIDALKGPLGLATNGDGSHVYVAAENSWTLSHLALDGKDNLALVSCISIISGCTTPPVYHAFDGADGLALAGGGRELYVGAAGLSHLRLDATGAALFLNCLGDAPGCAATSPSKAVDGAGAIAVTADGRHMYAAAGNQLADLAVDAGGNTGLRSCVGDLFGCTPTSPAGALDGATSLALSPDGRSLYATSYNGNALVHLAIEQPPGATPILGPGSRLAPLLSAFAMTRTRFRVAPPATALAARHRHRHAARGSGFRYTLDSPAGVKITISALMPGRRRGPRCVASSRRLRKKPRCTRAVVRGTLTRVGHAGSNQIPFSGRLGRRALPPGRYRATIVATNNVGASPARAVTFTIVRR